MGPILEGRSCSFYSHFIVEYIRPRKEQWLAHSVRQWQSHSEDPGMPLVLDEELTLKSQIL